MNKWKKYWIIFGVALAVFITISTIFWNEDWDAIIIQIGALTFTLAAMLMIMVQNGEQIEESTNTQIGNLKETTNEQIKEMQRLSYDQIDSNKKEIKKLIETILETTNNHINELQKSTEKQIESSKEETVKLTAEFQSIVDKQIQNFTAKMDESISSLEEVSEVLLKMSDQNKELIKESEERKKIAEEHLLQKTNQIQKVEYEKLSAIERKRPIIYLSFIQEEHLLLFKRIWLYIYNDGGTAQSVKVTAQFFNNEYFINKYVNFRSVKRLGKHRVKIGKPKDFQHYNMIRFELIVHDADGRMYQGIYQDRIQESVWIPVSLIELENSNL